MFTPAEYRSGKTGWGHSTWEAGIMVAKAAEVDQLILSHFNPSHTDRNIDKILSRSQKEFPKTLPAKEGQRITL